LLWLPAARVTSGDRGEVDGRVVDAIEDIGEGGGREREADVDELRVAVAGGLDRGERLRSYRAALLAEDADEADQRIALGVAGRLALADVLQFIGIEASKLAEQAVRGDAVVAAGDTAEHELDGFLIAPGQRARGEHAVGGQDRLESLGTI